MEASVLDLRKKMREVMSAIDHHEHVILTHRGRPRAVILPLKDEKACKVKVADLPAFGLWKERQDIADPVVYVEKLRQTRGF